MFFYITNIIQPNGKLIDYLKIFNVAALSQIRIAENCATSIDQYELINNIALEWKQKPQFSFENLFIF